ncbi:MAG: DUF2490 domain-containing protein [Sphingomonadales bacterium]|jgi:hypothetical protein
MPMRRLLLPLALLPALAARAEDVKLAADDTQLWTTVQLQMPVGGHGQSVSLQVQNRLVENVNRAALQSLRLGYGRQLGEDVNVQGGYSLFQSQPLGRPSTLEHRFWQQVQGPAGQLGPVQLSWRVGMEERLFERFGDMGLRARGQLRASTNARLAPLLQTEGFYNLNSTDWGQRAGRDQVRLMAGGTYRFSRHASLEGGYMYIRLWRPGGDRSLNVINLTLLLRG